MVVHHSCMNCGLKTDVLSFSILNLQCTVRATVIGFSTKFAGQTHEEERTFHTLTDAIQLQLVSSLRVTPEYVLLVFHPDAQENLIVSGGTCSLDASTNDTHVVQIVKHPGKSLCSQLILGANGLGKAIVTIQDVGLSPRATTYSLARVANVDWIQIIAEEHISLMVQGSAFLLCFDFVSMLILFHF
jgi:nuclear pore complex protein Nup210